MKPTVSVFITYEIEKCSGTSPRTPCNVIFSYYYFTFETPFVYLHICIVGYLSMLTCYLPTYHSYLKLHFWSYLSIHFRYFTDEIKMLCNKPPPPPPPPDPIFFILQSGNHYIYIIKRENVSDKIIYREWDLVVGPRHKLYMGDVLMKHSYVSMQFRYLTYEIEICRDTRPRTSYLICVLLFYL